MNKRQKARLALEILNETRSDHPYRHLLTAQADDIADELIELVSKDLIEQGAGAIDQLLDLGYSNKKISEKTGYDESTLTRVKKKSDELQIALSTLRDLVGALKTFLAHAKVARINQSLNTSSIIAISFCSLDKTVTENDRRAAARAVVTNLTRSLSGNAGKRVPLPPNILGVLLRIGSWENGLRVYQSEGQNDAEILKHEIHELEEMLKRMKDDLDRLSCSGRTDRPKGAF